MVVHEGKNAVARKDRIKFGAATILYSKGAMAFSPLHTVIIRALGGNDVHLGIMGGMLLSLGNVLSWVGTLILKKSKTHRKGMVVALILSTIIQALVVATLLYGAQDTYYSGIVLIVYLVLVGLMAVSLGAEENIQTSWIGDLVAHPRRGWFVSGVAILSNIGLVILQLVFAQLTSGPGLFGFALSAVFLVVNTLLAILVVWTITDRPSQAINFIVEDESKPMNYHYRPMWGLIGFETLWRGGRISLMTFSTAYLIDQMGYHMGKIILIHMIVNVINIMTLFFVGPLSDRIGIIKPLAVISSACGLSMFLWITSAWWGIIPIIVYQLINGAAGTTHFMLLNNLSLQLYPSVGRPNYLSFARTVVGIITIVASVGAGYLLSLLRGWEFPLWGAAVNHYHVFFLGCTLFTLCSLVPLYYLYRAEYAFEKH